jgi:hypothetical protein
VCYTEEVRKGKITLIFDEVKRIAVIQAIGIVRDSINWKPGKANTHLAKRISLGHLPDEATIEQYNAIVTSVVNSRDANVYLYVFRDREDRETIYPTLVANVENKIWLVMIGLDGVLETAFPPDEGYLGKPEFIYLGSVKELET